MKNFELKSHNIPTVEGIRAALLKGVKKICTVRATGTGKSYIIADIASDYKKVLFLAPRKIILDQQKNINKEKGLENIETNYLTYYMASRISWNKESNNYDLIICDECHRMLARVWKEKGVDEIIKFNPRAKIVGFTATNVRGTDKLDVVNEFFDGNIVDPLTLPRAWSEGILRTPRYISGLYTFSEFYNDQIDKIEKFCETRENKIEAKNILETAKIDWRNSGGVSGIFKKYLHKNTRKLIFFLESIDQINKMQSTIKIWLEEAGFNPEIHTIHSLKTNNERELESFRERTKNKTLKVMLSVNILNEGIHIGQVDGVIFLRKTMSNVIYIQQLGRCLSFKETKSKHPIVIDLVGNLDNAGTIITQLREELLHIEREKLLKGEKSEKDLITFEIEGDILSQLKIIERIKRLYTSDYLSEAKRRFHENDFSGIIAEDNFYKWCRNNRNNIEIAKLCFEKLSTLLNIRKYRDNVKNDIESILIRNPNASGKTLRTLLREIDGLRWLSKNRNKYPKLYEDVYNKIKEKSRRELAIEALNKGDEYIKSLFQKSREIAWAWENKEKDELAKNLYEKWHTFSRERQITSQKERFEKLVIEPRKEKAFSKLDMIIESGDFSKLTPSLIRFCKKQYDNDERAKLVYDMYIKKRG